MIAKTKYLDWGFATVVSAGGGLNESVGCRNQTVLENVGFVCLDWIRGAELGLEVYHNY
jgi:hypothetical protein